jgi:hypothetical protein
MGDKSKGVFDTLYAAKNGKNLFLKIFADNVRWLIQVPRLFDIYRINNCVENFQVSAPRQYCT